MNQIQQLLNQASSLTVITPNQYEITQPLVLPKTECFRLYLMPGVLLIQKCEYLFQLNSTLKYFSITGGSVDADLHNSMPRPLGLFSNTDQEAPANTAIYITDVEFKGELEPDYIELLQNLNTQRVWANGQTL